MENAGRVGLAASLFLALSAFRPGNEAQAAGGPDPGGEDSYRVLAPIESGNLLLFPVVRVNGRDAAGTPFITLDEGIRSGEVEVTEAGNVEGLVRPRSPAQAGPVSGFRSAQVNTLVLVTNPKKPPLSLGGHT